MYQVTPINPVSYIESEGAANVPICRDSKTSFFSPDTKPEVARNKMLVAQPHRACRVTHLEIWATHLATRSL